MDWKKDWDVFSTSDAFYRHRNCAGFQYILNLVLKNMNMNFHFIFLSTKNWCWLLKFIWKGNEDIQNLYSKFGYDANWAMQRGTETLENTLILFVQSDLFMQIVEIFPHKRERCLTLS